MSRRFASEEEGVRILTRMIITEAVAAE